MTTLGQILAAVAILANGIVYGTDVLAGLVMRSVYAQLDDATVTASAGWGHYYADKRMPFAGAGGLIAAVGTVVVAAVGGHTAATVAAAITLVSLLVWLGLYVRIAKPINAVQTAAALAGTTPANARELQDTWDGIVWYRIALQTTAIAGLCAALALF